MHMCINFTVHCMLWRGVCPSVCHIKMARPITR